MIPRHHAEQELITYAQHIEYLESIEPTDNRDSLISFMRKRAEKYTNHNLHCIDIRLTKDEWVEFNEWRKSR